MKFSTPEEEFEKVQVNVCDELVVGEKA